ncbi:MAG: glycoside hydrolase family 127 protein [Bacteroidetes bacterium]|nr:glycoside hydrolase family 127 protein [Bacteroidota bacterium]
MISKSLFCTVLIVFLYSSSPAQSVVGLKHPARYYELAPNVIKPQGWLLRQLEIMRAGTTGHLDEVYGKVKNDNGWLGGKGDGWEETPYWLDGAVPLAYLLDDTVMKAKVKRYVDWSIARQRPSGYFGPVTRWERETGQAVDVAHAVQGEDWWPKMVMLKVIQQYYLSTHDTRVVPFMTRYFHYQLQALKAAPLGHWTQWATYRGQDNVLTAQWLYTITKDPKLLALATLIQSQSAPWSAWFNGRSWVINAAAHQNNEDWMSRHGVNVAMGLKDPAVHYERTGEKKYLDAIHTGFKDLMTLHGLPNGMFSADEDLHGNAPEQGTELCAITEAMYALETTVAVTGEVPYMDAIERIAFNALPAQTTDDYNCKQYFQVANQVNIKRGVFNFSLPFERGMNNVLGMRSGYTCCLANMHQGWAKFATHLWYGTSGGGLAALAYAPNNITTKVGSAGEPVTIRETTDYPFDNTITFTIQTAKPVSFPIVLRIPGWCKQAVLTVNGRAVKDADGGKLVTIDRRWNAGDVIRLELPMQVEVSEWGRNSRAVERGPLVYALKLGERWEKGRDEKEGDYFSVFSTSDWNYGLTDSAVAQPGKMITVRQVKPVSADFNWNLEQAPIELSAPARKIPDWTIVNDVAPEPVTSREGLYKGRVDERLERVTLVPYGFTKVRIVAFPTVK